MPNTTYRVFCIRPHSATGGSTLPDMPGANVQKSLNNRNDRMTNGMQTLELDGPLTIRTITKIKEQIADSLVEARTRNADLQIAVDSDVEIDLTLPQLLLAAQSQAARLGTKLVLKNPVTGNFLSILERGGFVAKSGPENTMWLQGDLL